MLRPFRFRPAGLAKWWGLAPNFSAKRSNLVANRHWRPLPCAPILGVEFPPIMTRCGLYDSDLSVWDDHQAFVLTNNHWYSADAFEMFCEARINVEWSFVRQLMAEAPPLPHGAFAR